MHELSLSPLRGWKSDNYCDRDSLRSYKEKKQRTDTKNKEKKIKHNNLQKAIEISKNKSAPKNLL